MTQRISMQVERFRAANANEDIYNIHPDDAEDAFPNEMQLVGIWFGKPEGLSVCPECSHGVETHKVRFVKPVGTPENRFEWIGCSRCAEDDPDVIRACFGEQK